MEREKKGEREKGGKEGVWDSGMGHASVIKAFAS